MNTSTISPPKKSSTNESKYIKQQYNMTRFDGKEISWSKLENQNNPPY